MGALNNLADQLYPRQRGVLLQHRCLQVRVQVCFHFLSSYQCTVPSIFRRFLLSQIAVPASAVTASTEFNNQILFNFPNMFCSWFPPGVFLRG